MFSHEFINTPTSFVIDESRIQDITLLLSREVLRVQKGKVNLAFVTDDVMREYNKQYREKDSTTDVLSFHYFDDFSGVPQDEVVGEVIFSETKILSQAAEHGHDPEKEFQILLIHSLLHLLGFDHEDDKDYQEMWQHELPLRRALHLA